jgi:hypothetical protein
MTTSQSAHVKSRRVVRVEAGSRWVLWPYAAQGAHVSRFGTGIEAAAKLSAEEIVELVLLSTDELGEPWVPADLACAWGFITRVHRDTLVDQAAANRRAAVNAASHDNGRTSDKLRSALRSAVEDPRRFGRLARQHSVHGGPFTPAWRWAVSSIADALVAGATDEQLTWLVGAVHDMRTRALERAMQRAAMEAYWLGAPPPDDIV